jgi:WD40 repeat protein
VLTLREHRADIRSVAYAPDARSLATCADDATVRIWDLPSGKPRLHRGFDGGPEVLAFCPGGKYLACGTADGRVILWDSADWRSDANSMNHAGGVRCLACAPDSQSIVSAGWDRVLAVWRVPSLFHQPLSTSEEGVAGLAFTPDGKSILVAGQKGSLDRYDLARRSRVDRQSTGKPISSLAASSNGRLLAFGHGDGVVTLWDSANNRTCGELRGHTWTVYGLAFTPDGQTLVSGGADGTVRTWDVAGRRERHAYRWHTSWVTCLAVAPDGMTAAAGSDDHTVVVWDLDDA